jgi:hypothetical protein
MSDHPTLTQLRARVFKHSPPAVGWVREAQPTTCASDTQSIKREGQGVGRAALTHPTRLTDPTKPEPSPEIGNWLARRAGRPAALYGTWLAVRLGLSAHQVTLLSLVAALASAFAIGTGSRAGFITGVVFAHLAFWLDHIDGQVARWRQTASLDGVYFDYLMHHAQTMALGFGLGYGLAIHDVNPTWAIAGFLISVGWAFLALHNDCRYKAFFQTLKKDGQSYRLDGGAGGRPAPPEAWPRNGRGMLTWPLFKACEPHVVLLALTGLSIPALIAPTAWIWLWRSLVLGMAVLAPLLAIGRAARAIRRGTVTQEFDRWFRPQTGP